MIDVFLTVLELKAVVRFYHIATLSECLPSLIVLHSATVLKIQIRTECKIQFRSSENDIAGL